MSANAQGGWPQNRSSELAVVFLLLMGLAAMYMLLRPDRVVQAQPQADQLRMAVRLNDMEAIKRQVAAGFDIDLPASQGTTLLAEAVAAGHIQMASLLLQSGSRVDAINPATGETPLFIAVRANRPDFIRLLMTNGADPDRMNLANRTPLMVAVESRAMLALEQLLLSGAAITRRTPQGENALMQAARQGALPEADRLINADAPLEERNLNRETALTIAVKNGQAAVAKLLLDSGAVIHNEMDIAVQIYNKTIIRMLLERNSTISDATSQTLMRRVKQEGDLEFMAFLASYGLERGPNVGLQPLPGSAARVSTH